ncbi:acyl--CoA ligase [Plantactinospora sp. S1510]|uniref:Acyl--CoA ligase n=1 Tax=Plantactinospora alkalitolerans TaxID=2789879 RepID=A0ABS0GRK9_9ACTN|nr:class I adenylate-forming enzyme family protein [Plantactinospora alkalitolerans]MBF9128839.1 acyl--CoA ligase [Plantactinospora alkalitolerans]
MNAAPFTWTVAEQFGWMARRHPRSTALVDEAGEQSYEQLFRRVEALAGHLGAVVGSGRVGIYVSNRREWAETFLAGQLAGIGVVPVNERYQGQEIRHIIEDAGIELLVSDRAAHRGDVLAELRGDVDVLPVGPDYERALDGSATAARRPPNVESSVLYTSGTTALPKGVRLTQANQALGTWLGPSILLGLTAADTVLITTPLAHRVGQVRLLGGILTGCRTVLCADARPGTFVDAVRRYRATVTGMVPTIARDIAMSGTVGDRLASLRVFSVTGEAMSAELRETVARMLPDTDLWTFFASTETGLATALPPSEFIRRPTSSGRSLPGVEIAVLGPTGAAEPVGEGQILVRSGPPGSFAVGGGYIGHAAGAAFVDADGWFHTGDIGRIDEDGWLAVTGRSKDMILSGGFNIAAQEVEGVLRRHPAVRDAAVTGEPDERFGERVVAWIVTEPAYGPGITADELRDFTASQVASFKKPRVVHFVTDLPRTATGKVAKWRLSGTGSPS